MKNYLSILLLFAFLLSTSMLTSCDKDPEVIIETETITIIDTVIIVDTVTVVETIIETIQDTATTYILVRHAETSSIGSNPNLSSAGQQRAQTLKRMLSNVSLNAVYSTNFNRTMETATPTASDHALPVLQYDPFAPDALIESTLISAHDGVVLIVGHSNTTPDFLNVMVGDNIYADLPETEYDNLYIVSVFEKGRAKVTHLKY